MSGVTFNAITTAASGAANFIASDLYSVSTDGANKGNFNLLVGALNSGAMNSVNYSNSAFLSQHFSIGQIISQHISNSQVKSQHVSASAIRSSHLNFKSSDNGVRAVQIGAHGLKGCVVTNSFSGSLGATTHSDNFMFSDALQGDPSFTDTPTIAGRPLFQTLSTGHKGAQHAIATAINSVSVDMIYGSADAGTVTYTVFLEVIGVT